MKNAANTFFELDPGQGEIASAMRANDTNVTSDASHAEMYTFLRTGMRFFHFENIADSNSHYLRHSNTSQKYVYIDKYITFSADCTVFFQKNTILSPIGKNYMKKNLIFFGKPIDKQELMWYNIVR